MYIHCINLCAKYETVGRRFGPENHVCPKECQCPKERQYTVFTSLHRQLRKHLATGFAYFFLSFSKYAFVVSTLESSEVEEEKEKKKEGEANHKMVICFNIS